MVSRFYIVHTSLKYGVGGTCLSHTVKTVDFNLVAVVAAEHIPAVFMMPNWEKIASRQRLNVARWSGLESLSSGQSSHLSESSL